jgi:hypothetical protein
VEAGSKCPRRGDRTGSRAVEPIVVLAFALTSCGGRTDPDAERGGQSPDLEALARVCDRFFERTPYLRGNPIDVGGALNGQFAPRCGGPVLPDSETTRLRSSFGTSCVDELVRSGIRSTDLEACVAALDSVPCESSGLPQACDLRGSLPAGAPCIVGVQCQSGACNDFQSLPPGGLSSPISTCGKCAPLSAPGQPCRGAGCPPGSVCTTTTTAPDSIYICVPVVQGDVGATCDEHMARCRPGLYCEAESGRCTSLRGIGETCGLRQTGCQRPLVCKRTCQSPALAGGSCGADTDCAVGMACAEGKCTAIAWATPGSPCDESRRCVVGLCPVYFPGAPRVGTCPSVTSEGQACNGASTCDTLSACANATSSNPTRGGTCAPLSSVVCR